MPRLKVRKVDCTLKTGANGCGKFARFSKSRRFYLGDANFRFGLRRASFCTAPGWFSSTIFSREASNGQEYGVQNLTGVFGKT